MPSPFELVELDADPEQDQGRVMVWRFTEPHQAISSAAVGGGLKPINWITNIGVTMKYRRTDLAAHAAEVAGQLDLAGPGSTLFTAADISQHQTALVDGVCCDVTVGISKPTWAAGADGTYTAWSPGSRNSPTHHGQSAVFPGTINTVLQLPVGLEAGAAVNAVMTATEAKSQALFEAGVPGTGTASDAVVICWSSGAPLEVFAGPRSVWGARLARATHVAVAAAIAAKAHTE